MLPCCLIRSDVFLYPFLSITVGCLLCPFLLNTSNGMKPVQQEELSLLDYLKLCKEDPSVYANAAERMLKAIGEPEVIDTARDPRLSRIFSNKLIKR